MKISFIIFLIFLSISFIGCNTEIQQQPEETFIKNEDFLNKIQFIKFSLNHSMRIPNNKINIEIIAQHSNINMHVKSQSSNNDIQWTSFNTDTSFSITKKQFQQVIKKAQVLNHLELSKQLLYNLGNDGNRCTIEIGNFQNSLTYKIWTPNYDTEKRKLNDFMQLCQNIIALSGLPNEHVF